MATAEEWLAVLNDESTDDSMSADDWLSELNSGGYQPVRTPSYEQDYRAERLRLIRQQSAEGKEPGQIFASLPQRRPGQQLTFHGQVAEESMLADLTMPERMVFGGAALIGAAIENPVLRLMGRGDEADRNTRAANALMSFGQEQAKNSVLGETLGPIVENVGTSLSEGTLASLSAPVRGGTTSLAFLSTAFGINGYDRAYVEAKDAGIPEEEASKAGARQFVVDGVLTFAGGKIVQNLGFNPGRYLGPVIGRTAQRVAEKSGLSNAVGSALLDGGVEGTQGALTYLNEVYTGLHDFKLADFATTFATEAAVGGLAGAATSGVQVAGERLAQFEQGKRLDKFTAADRKTRDIQKAFAQFQKDMPKAVKGVVAANEFAATATPEQIQKAVVAATPKDFEAATGQKGKGPTHREAFQEELEALIELQAEVEQRTGLEHRSLEAEEAAINQRQDEIAIAETEFAEMNEELKAIEADFRDRPDIRPSRPRANKSRNQADPGPFPLDSVSATHALPGSDIDATAAQKAATPKEVTRNFSEARREVVQLRRQMNERRIEIDAARKSLLEDFKKFTDRTIRVEGESARQRAYLEGELDRITAAEREAAETPGSQPAERGPQITDIEPPVRQRTPKTFAKRYDDISQGLMEIGEISARTHDGQTLDNATRRDLGRLIDTHVEGQASRISLFNEAAKAQTPAQIRKVLGRLGEHMHKAEVRLAKQDYENAVKKAKGLRPEFAETVKQAQEGVKLDSVDSTRDAAEAIRAAIYQSMMADSYITGNRAKGIKAEAEQSLAEMETARPLRMQADTILGAIKGDPSAETARTIFSPDTPLFREDAMRPENQFSRLSETMHERIYRPLSVEGQAEYQGYVNEAEQGLGDLLDSLGLTHGGTFTDTAMNIITFGRGTAWNRWSKKTRRIEGQNLTRLEALDLVTDMLDPENARNMRLAGVKYEDGRRFQVVDERVESQLFDFVGDEGLQIAEWMFRYYNTTNAHRINDANRLLTGRDMITKFNRVPRRAEGDLELVGGENPMRALQDSTLKSYRHFKYRDTTNNPLYKPRGSDAISNFLHHTDRSARFAAFAPRARDATALLNSEGVKQKIIEKEGLQGWDHMAHVLERQVLGPRPTSKTGMALRRHNAVAMASLIAGRMSTVLLTPASAILAPAYRPKGIRTYLRNLPAALASNDVQNRMDAVLSEASPLYARVYKMNGYTKEVTGGVYRREQHFNPPTLADHFLRPLRETTRVTTDISNYLDAELAATAEGFEPGTQEWKEKVAREWELNHYRSETASHAMELPGFLLEAKENPWMAVWANFQNQGSRLYSLAPRMFDLMDAGKYKDAIGVGAALMSSAVAVGLVRSMMRQPEEDEGFLEALAKNSAEEVIGSAPLAGQFMQVAARQMMGRRTFPSDPLLASTASQFLEAGATMMEAIITRGDESDDPKAFSEALAKSVGAAMTLIGVPFSGIDDLRKRLAAAGETESSGILDVSPIFPGLRREAKEGGEWASTVDLLTLGEQ